MLLRICSAIAFSVLGNVATAEEYHCDELSSCNGLGEECFKHGAQGNFVLQVLPDGSGIMGWSGGQGVASTIERRQKFLVAQEKDVGGTILTFVLGPNGRATATLVIESGGTIYPSLHMFQCVQS